MTFHHRDQELGAYFAMSTNFSSEYKYINENGRLISLIWNISDQPVTILVDDREILLEPDMLTTTTYLQVVTIGPDTQGLLGFSFNREFYCIQDHDHEVSCNGVLFLGTQEPPLIQLDKAESQKFNMLFEVFKDEFETKDNIQGEMLRMLLKRLIIKTTRLAKAQLITSDLDEGQVDTIRKFNVLVDLHYREKKQVADYADLLFKSPKTLSNLFAKYNQKSPLQIIHERIILEAKRLLLYTDKSGKEIAHELG
ncbi:MAG: AraC family transcriptional regulator, partial [Bacteroidota bacterium]